MFALIVLLAGFGLSFWVCGYAIGWQSGRTHNIELYRPGEIVLLSVAASTALAMWILVFVGTKFAVLGYY